MLFVIVCLYVTMEKVGNVQGIDFHDTDRPAQPLTATFRPRVIFNPGTPRPLIKRAGDFQIGSQEPTVALAITDTVSIDNDTVDEGHQSEAIQIDENDENDENDEESNETENPEKTIKNITAPIKVPMDEIHVKSAQNGHSALIFNAVGSYFILFFLLILIL